LSAIPFKRKSEVLEVFKQYQTWVELIQEKKIKEFQSDNRGEYTEHNFEFCLEKNGIVHWLSVPHTVQQNGMAERLNQTLLNVIRCLLIHSGLPRSFWAEALQTASYICNVCPSSAIGDIIPFELSNNWKLECTVIDHLRLILR
jgi:transposase InsO family protein